MPTTPDARSWAATATLASAALISAVILIRRRRPSGTAVVWLQSSLRVGDNEAIRRAAETSDRLLVVYVWRFGKVPVTPAQMLECAAARALGRALAGRGSHLLTLQCGDAATAVARAAAAVDARDLFVDASGPDGVGASATLEAALASLGCGARVSKKDI